MKNLFNKISQEEKNRILEMHSGKKNVMSEQSISGALDWIKDKVGMKTNSASSYKVEATVEGDMVMEFPVVQFYYDNNNVTMFIKDRDGKILYVNSKDTEFKGPIFETQTGKKRYYDSIFPDITTKNWKTIAKQHNIPVSEITV